METRANHVLVGAFTVAVVVFGLLFALWMAKALSDRNWDEFDVVFTEAVTGLSRGGVVQFNGISVGEVRDLSLDHDDPGKVIARIRVDANTPVRADTTARLSFAGLTGVTQILLAGGQPGSPLLRDTAVRGEVPRIVARDSAFANLLAQSEDLTATASEALLRINRLLDDRTVDNVARTMAHLEQISGALAGERESIAALLRDASESAARLERVLQQAESTMGGLDRSVAVVDRELPALIAQTRRTLSEIETLAGHGNALVEDNREAIQRFGQTGLAQAGPTLVELRSLLRQLNRAAARIEESPAQALLGGATTKEYRP
ncbi:MlaD family protein [Silanimonas sp.]|uniref:MlaD family protein n=1 Tax=Silanimonas sp. TaxID=1929290 RepID=UPI001BBFDC16|nr:MlaD family protein [Silanimonas sp.]MBS3895428.1 MCE family protein [Silanimonas sp.]MBS3923864.1 MCE family protein [Xanthomonadaceae bacterium]